jgi:hypothetical protein
MVTHPDRVVLTGCRKPKLALKDDCSLLTTEPALGHGHLGFPTGPVGQGSSNLELSGTKMNRVKAKQQSQLH